nr:hypothetical protein [Seongchinamella sediminis]
MYFQPFDCRRDQFHLPRGAFGFGLLVGTVHPGTTDFDRPTLEVDIFPGQRDQLRDSQSRPERKPHHVDFLHAFCWSGQDSFDFCQGEGVGIFPITQRQVVDRIKGRVVANVISFCIFEYAAQNNHDFVDGFIGERDEVQCNPLLYFCLRD